MIKNSDKVEGSDAIFLINNYKEIIGNIIGRKDGIPNSFINKINSFYATTQEFVTSKNLPIIISLIDGNNKLENNLMHDVISQSYKYLYDLDKDSWLKAFKENDEASIIELLFSLLSTERHKNIKLPLNANTAYSEIIESISKKKIPIPEDIDYWNDIYGSCSTNQITTFKNVRDELLNHEHPAVTIEELVFFEKGLFQNGVLDESKNIADNSLRRILIPLAGDDERYLKILKGNAENIRNIITQAYDSIVDFKLKLDSKCPKILIDEDFKPASSLLIERFEILKPKDEDSKTKELKTELKSQKNRK